MGSEMCIRDRSIIVLLAEGYDGMFVRSVLEQVPRKESTSKLLLKMFEPLNSGSARHDIHDGACSSLEVGVDC